MKKRIFIPLIFLIFVFINCNKTVAEELIDDLIEEDAVKTEITAEEDTEEKNLSLLSKIPIDYSITNRMINYVIKQKIISVMQFFGKYLLIAWSFFLTWPVWLRIIFYTTALFAVITTFASQIIGIYQNIDEWEKHPNHELMYSYFIYSGNYRRKKSYKEARNLVYDKKHFWYSLAGLAYRLGNYSNTSSFIMFILSFVYIPLAILGAVEMIFRRIFGTFWLFVYNKMFQFLLFITRLISFLLIPLSKMIDKIILKTQYCGNCYSANNLPYFICPSCDTVHKELVPGRCGVLFVRCSCNNKFLPCTSFTGRSNLTANCKECNNELVAGNAKHFSIAVVGGNDSGKTAYIAAFSNIYTGRRKNTTITGKPKNLFDELSRAFKKGDTKSDTEPCTYSFIHKHRISIKDNLVFYDTMDESILSESFPRSPKYLGYCDGIILIIDPLSVKSVRKEHSESQQTSDIDVYSEDDIDHLTGQFINQFFRIRGQSTGTMSEVPVAVVINKTDIPVVNQEIGWEAIDDIYDKDPASFKYNFQEAENWACREYLIKIGLLNLINNIDATFANVQYFSVSAIGHTAQDNKKFEPTGVIKPVIWIAKQRGTRLLKYLTSIKIGNVKI